MAKEYKVGERYYLPVAVFTTDAQSIDPIGLKYVYTGNGNTGAMYLSDYPDLLLTAEEIALVINTERDDALAELKSRNAELEALLKEVMATRDEAIKQNDELITENKKLKAENGAWQVAAQTCADNAKVADKATEELRKENKDLKAKAAENADTISRLSANKVALTEEVGKLRETIADRTIDVQHLTEENEKLKAELDQRNKDFWAMKKDRDELDSIGGKLRAENDNLKEWYEEANKTATEAAEANDELKAKIADLRNRVGEQLAQIQDLNAEVHFLKAERDKFAKTAKDKADLANKACDERNDEHGDLVTAKAAIDYLQEENKKLKQEHKDVEAAYDVVAETSIKRKNRITTMEEVIVALVEKIRRLESDD